MNISKITLLGVFTALVISPVLATQILVNPNFDDARFQPADKLHAGCENSANIVLDTVPENIKELKLELQYNPDDIEIIRLIPNDTDSKSTYAIEYGKINFSKNNFKSTNLFKIQFKSNEHITGTLLVFGEDSYIITEKNQRIGLGKGINIAFASVPECQPDIMPPSIRLIQPKTTQEVLPQDMFFVRDIKDNEKGIDKDSLSININGKYYTGDSSYIRRSGSYLAFFPEDWLPVNDKVIITLSIKDKQLYGGANNTEKIFGFSTSSGLTFRDYVNPNRFRSVLYQTKETIGSTTECLLIQSIYSKSDISYKLRLASILKKMGCPTTFTPLDDDKKSIDGVYMAKVDTKTKQQMNKNMFISVFAVIGWLLFLVTFLLKLHYIVGYHLHKRRHKYYKNIVEKK